MKKFIRKIQTYSPYILFIVLVCVMILYFYQRDLPQKPIIDVIITSLSSLISACIAAFVAYFVANMQIENEDQQRLLRKKEKLISSVRLLNHELEYNIRHLSFLNSNIKENDDSNQTYLQQNLKSNVWDNLAMILIEDLDSDLFNKTISCYNDIEQLKRGYQKKLLTVTLSNCVQIHTELKLFVERKSKELQKNNSTSH